MEIFAAVTANAPCLHKVPGSIEPGKTGDLVIMD